MLRLHTESAALSVDFAALAVNGSVEEIAGIKLQAGLGSENVHDAPAVGLVDLCRLGKAADVLVQYPIVIVAAAEFKLLVVFIDPRADGGRLGEIERGAGDDLVLARWNEIGVDRA